MIPSPITTTPVKYTDYILLTALAILFFLPGFFTLPVMDRDEARFAQASKQMLETGDYIDIRFQNEPRHKKPAGIYWLQAASTAVSNTLRLTDTSEPVIWTYRIPSLLGAIIAVLGTTWGASALVGRKPALFAGAILASCLLLTVEARLAKTDAVLLGTSVLAMAALIRLYQNHKSEKVSVYTLWIALAVGVLVKGPIIFLPVVTSIIVLCTYMRSTRWLGDRKTHIRGMLVFCLIALPWYILITIQTNGVFFQEALGNDFAQKITSVQESHGAPPGIYVLSLLVTFWPWTPLLLISLMAIWRLRRHSCVIFCMAWSIPTWLILELIPTKLPHYILPLLPALAILTAFSVKDARNSPLFEKILFTIVAVILAVAMIGAPFYLKETPSIFGIVCSLGVVVSLIWYWRIPDFHFTGKFVVAWFAYTGVIAGTLPYLNAPFISAQLADTAHQCTNEPVGVAGYHEPSLVFLAGTQTVLTTPEQIENMILSDRIELGFMPSHLAKPINTFPVANVTGLNYNGGDPVNLTGYAKDPDLCTRHYLSD